MIRIITTDTSLDSAMVQRVLQHLDEPYCIHGIQIGDSTTTTCDRLVSDAIEHTIVDQDAWHHDTWMLVAPANSILAICLVIEIYGRSGQLPLLINGDHHHAQSIDLAHQRAIAGCRRDR